MVTVSALELAPYFCGAARGLGFVVFLPFGWDVVGVVQRLAIAAGFAIGVPVTTLGNLSESTFINLVGYLIAGAALGWPIALLTDVAAGVGELVDSARGVMIAEVLDPLQSNTASHFAVLARYSTWIFFLSAGGMALVVPALANANPPSSIDLVTSGHGAFKWIVSVFNDGMLLIAPMLVLLFMCDVAVGIVGKLSSNISLSTEATLLKLVVCTVLIAQALQYVEPAQVLQVMFPYGIANHG